MSRICNPDKVNIYVPEKTGAALKRDAELFEIFKSDGDVNLNRFLSNLIVGYYNGYKQERNSKMAAVKEIVYPFLREKKKLEEISEKLMEDVILPAVPKRKGKNPVRLSLKPTLETDQTLTEISLADGQEGSVSQYLCRMFMSYCEKPTYERERIIYRERLTFLEEACSDHSEITFATVNNPGLIHHVIPYEIVAGQDETFNYLLCQEYNSATEKNEAKSYRLCRINRPSYYHTSGVLVEEVVQHLEKMKRIAPQYSINDDTKICIRFTSAGQRSYRMIYTGRPPVDRIEQDKEKQEALYYFSCSQEQVYRYILRFNAGEANIQYPVELKKKVHDYYMNAMNSYE